MKYSILFSILIVTLNSCDSPSVVEELSNEQVLELIQTDEGYEDIIRQLKSVNYLFEKDPVLKAEFSNYSYAQFFDLKNYTIDSAIISNAFESGYEIAKERFESTKIAYKNQLGDTLDKIRQIDASEVANIEFEKYRYTESKEKYEHDRRKKSFLDFKVRSEKPLKAARIKYNLTHKLTDGTMREFSERGIDKYIASKGFQFSFSKSAESNTNPQSEFTLTSVLRYDGVSMDHEREIRYYAGFANMYGDKTSTEDFLNGEYNISINSIELVDSENKFYSWPVFYQLKDLEYKNEYSDEEFFKLTRFFFNSPNSMINSNEAYLQSTVLRVLYETSIPRILRESDLENYLTSTFGFNEYLTILSEKDELGLKLLFLIEQNYGKTDFQKLIE
jgi:hypothetical protein